MSCSAVLRELAVAVLFCAGLLQLRCSPQMCVPPSRVSVQPAARLEPLLLMWCLHTWTSAQHSSCQLSQGLLVGFCCTPLVHGWCSFESDTQHSSICPVPCKVVLYSIDAAFGLGSTASDLRYARLYCLSPAGWAHIYLSARWQTASQQYSLLTQELTCACTCCSCATGWAVTWLFLPDTTGLSLDELDRMAKYMLADEFQHYHGEGVNPKHLSTWERYELPSPLTFVLLVA